MVRVVNGEIVPDEEDASVRRPMTTSSGIGGGTSEQPFSGTSSGGSSRLTLNPLDYAAKAFWVIFRILLLFVQSIFAPPKAKLQTGQGPNGGPGGGPPGPRTIHQIRPPMGRG